MSLLQHTRMDTLSMSSLIVIYYFSRDTYQQLRLHRQYKCFRLNLNLLRLVCAIQKNQCLLKSSCRKYCGVTLSRNKLPGVKSSLRNECLINLYEKNAVLSNALFTVHSINKGKLTMNIIGHN